MCVFKKSVRRAFSSLVSSRLDLVGRLLFRSFWLIPMALGSDNTSFFFRIHVIRLLVGISLWLCSGLSLDCSPLGLYVPYALLCLLFASIVHTRLFTSPDMLRCLPSSPSSRISDLANTPLLVQKYIYITFILCHYLRSLSLPCLIWICYAFYIVIVDPVTRVATIIRHSYPFRPIGLHVLHVCAKPKKNREDAKIHL